METSSHPLFFPAPERVGAIQKGRAGERLEIKGSNPFHDP